MKQHAARAFGVIRDILIPRGYASRGAVIGAVIALTLLLTWLVPAVVLQHPAGLLAAVPIVLLAVIASALASLLAYGFSRLLSSRFIAVLVGVVAGTAVVLAILGSFILMVSSPLFLVFPYAMILGAVSGAAYAIHQYPSRKWKRLTVYPALVLVLLFAVVSVIWFAADGSDAHLVDGRANVPSPLPAIDLPDPSTPGPYPVARVFYGSGTDRQRPEFGVDVDVLTHPVDITPFLPDLVSRRRRGVSAGVDCPWQSRHE